jgi:hypothetical protein
MMQGKNPESSNDIREVRSGGLSGVAFRQSGGAYLTLNGHEKAQNKLGDGSPGE